MSSTRGNPATSSTDASEGSFFFSPPLSGLGAWAKSAEAVTRERAMNAGRARERRDFTRFGLEVRAAECEQITVGGRLHQGRGAGDNTRGECNTQPGEGR